MKYYIFILIVVNLLLPAVAEAKKKVAYRKTQQVSFDGTDVDGTARSPDGAYLLQKQGVKFMPLYKVNRQFVHSVKDSIEYLR
jgi:hypothetical protein